MSVQIRSGDVEPIEALIRDAGGEPLSGKADIVAMVRRDSDGLTLDWADLTFRAFGSCSTPKGAMTEVDAENYPGQYTLDLDTSAIANPAADDIYQVTVDQSPRSDAANVPQPGEVRVDGWAGTMEFVRKLLNNRQELAPGDANNMITYDDDDTTVLVRSSVTDVSGSHVTLAATAPARRSRGV